MVRIRECLGDGLLEMRRAGARTIGQDESTSVVYGMPKAAWDRGAVESQVPLTKVVETVLDLCAQRKVGEIRV